MGSGQTDGISHVFPSVKQTFHPIRNGMFIPVTHKPLLYVRTSLAIPVEAVASSVCSQLGETVEGFSSPALCAAPSGTTEATGLKT